MPAVGSSAARRRPLGLDGRHRPRRARAGMEQMADQLPTFIVIGAAKAGTTNLARVLAQHPDVFVTDPKEPAHFTGLGRYASVDDYLALFEAAGGVSARGEASTGYSRQATYRGVPERMSALVPDVRIVYLLRDPMERLRSHYRMRLRFGITEGSFEAFVTQSDGYVDTSCYGAQLRRYLDHFESEQIHVARLEDMVVDSAGVLRAIASHLGVDPTFFDGGVADMRTEMGPLRRYPAVPKPLRRITSAVPRRIRRLVKSRLPRLELSESAMTLDPRTEASLRLQFAADQMELRRLLPNPAIELYDYS